MSPFVDRPQMKKLALSSQKSRLATFLPSASKATTMGLPSCAGGRVSVAVSP